MTTTEAKMIAAVGFLRQTVTQQQALMKTLIQFALADPAQEQARLLLLKELEAAQQPLDTCRTLLADITSAP
jgi:hypothetical protein